TDPGDAFGWNSLHAFKRKNVKRPDEKLFIVDAMWIIVNEPGSGPNPGWLGQVTNYDLAKEWTTANTQRTTAWRHAGSANVLFFDGHVDNLRKEQIYSKDNTGNIIGNDRLWKVWQ